ncbi:MAG: cytidylate kinase-like family protein [Firmicutes bacterium]|nr:cytidylate kinase-like family protein [Bacillota bacterium]
MKRIITISREFGAAGGTIGYALAQKLGYEYFDKELILKAARASHMDPESVMRWDEKVSFNFGFAQSLFDFYNKPLSEKLYLVQEKVIREIGEKGNCVIVGRNANTILKEYENSLHVFIHANPYWRMEHMKAKMPDASAAKISEEMHAIDKARKKYCAYYTNTDFGVADYYDICLDSSSLGIDACINILYELSK